MGYTKRTITRDIRTSTIRQSRKRLRSTKSVKPTPSTRTERVLRSTTTPTSSPLPAPSSPKPRRRRARADPWAPKRKPKRIEQNPRPPRTHFACRICAESLPAADFVQYISPRNQRSASAEIPMGCISHLARSPWAKKREPVCRSCIGQSMAARLSLVGARKVASGCLEPGCSTPWNQTFILRFFPAGEALEKYSEDMLRVYLDDSKVVTCINKNCGARGLPDPAAPGFPQVVCLSSTCNIRFCATCLVPWHTDLSCAEYRARDINAVMTDPEKDTLKLMQERDGKRCPNCLIVIEKDGGCNGMYCEGCKTYFDWNTAVSAVPGSKMTVEGGLEGIDGRVRQVCEMDVLNATDEPNATEGREKEKAVV